MPEVRLRRHYLLPLILASVWTAGVLLLGAGRGLMPLTVVLGLVEATLMVLEERLSRSLDNRSRGISSSSLVAYAGAFLVAPAFLALHILLRLALNELNHRSPSLYRLLFRSAQVALAWLPGCAVIMLLSSYTGIGPAAVLALSILTLSIQETATERWILAREAGVSEGAHLYLARVSTGSVGVLGFYEANVWLGLAGIAILGLVMATLYAMGGKLIAQFRIAAAKAAQDADRRVAAAGDVEDRRMAVEKLAYSDTFIEGLGNRRRFERDLLDLDPTAALLVLGDVSGLKTINDGRGHPVGDLLLAAIGRALFGVAREHGMAYHFSGGDEYALMIERFPRERIGLLLAEIDACVADEVNKERALAGVRVWLRTGWGYGQTDAKSLRDIAETMLTERGLAEKRAGLGGRA